MKEKTIFITGASRGIGKAIALRLAKEGANIAIAAKTVEPHPKLEGTIHTAAAEIEEAGGRAFPVQVDIRDEEMVKAAVDKTVAHFGGIDVLINNASAINLSPTLSMPMKRYDLIHDINVRGTFMVSKYCIPHLKKGSNPHILILSPPLNMDPSWFGRHLPYTISKYGMSMIAMGLADEFREDGIGVNALWPKTTIATAAVNNLLGGEKLMKCSRTPQIVADAAYAVLSKPSRECTGNFFIDEEVLQAEGVTDFDQYAVDLSQPLMPDIFI
ncbi:MAG: NAD(P)-dependent oxidoreductase [Bacteroidota bacterium]